MAFLQPLLVSFLTHSIFFFVFTTHSSPPKKGRGHIRGCSFQLSAQRRQRCNFLQSSRTGFTSRSLMPPKFDPNEIKAVYLLHWCTVGSPCHVCPGPQDWPPTVSKMAGDDITKAPVTKGPSTWQNSESSRLDRPRLW